MIPRERETHTHRVFPSSPGNRDDNLPGVIARAFRGITRHRIVTRCVESARIRRNIRGRMRLPRGVRRIGVLRARPDPDAAMRAAPTRPDALRLPMQLDASWISLAAHRFSSL